MKARNARWEEFKIILFAANKIAPQIYLFSFLIVKISTGTYVMPSFDFPNQASSRNGCEALIGSDGFMSCIWRGKIH